MNERDYVVLVNKNGNSIGIEEKIKVHKNCLLHKAFSIFIFNNFNEMLIQQRGFQKYHFAGLWSNACCSHPMPEENIEQAAHRRLKEELGFDTTLKKAFSFIYKAKDVKSDLFEYEYDHLFLGLYEGVVFPDKEEINDYKWVKINKLLTEMKQLPAQYTKWFKVGINLLQKRELLSSSSIDNYIKAKEREV